MGVRVERMTLLIGMKKEINSQGFTLIELILVMFLLATMGALMAPSLSGVFRSRNIESEALRFFSVTEYARSEALSQGIPMILWLKSETGEYGIKAKEGYEYSGSRSLRYQLDPQMKFTVGESSSSKKVQNQEETPLIEFSPAGYLMTESLSTLQISDLQNHSLWIQKTADGMGYETSRKGDYESVR